MNRLLPVFLTLLLIAVSQTCAASGEPAPSPAYGRAFPLPPAATVTNTSAAFLESENQRLQGFDALIEDIYLEIKTPYEYGVVLNGLLK